VVLLISAVAYAYEPAPPDLNRVDEPDEVVEPDACGAATFPGESWAVHPAAAEVADSDAADALAAFLFPPDLDWGDKERRGTRTDGVVVIYQGQLLWERYDHGYDADTRHLAWSATKSFTNALAGVAVRDGLLSVDDGICDHLDGLPEASCAVTVGDLLSFGSGFDWLETYEGYSPRASSVLAMLYGEGHADMARFTASHPLRDAPGTTYMYSSGDTNVVAAVLGEVLSPRYGERYPWPALLDPIGMQATWERDAAGTFVGSSYLYATPRHLARFGQLLLHDGCWDGQRILPEGWVDWSTEVNEGIQTKALHRGPGDVQGRQFWLNRPVPEAGQDEPPWPNVPEDLFAARGHWKQSINVYPSHDLVVVRTGDDRDGAFSYDTFLSLALALAEEASP